jgi:hypothetical protein
MRFRRAAIGNILQPPGPFRGNSCNYLVDCREAQKWAFFLNLFASNILRPKPSRRIALARRLLYPKQLPRLRETEEIAMSQRQSNLLWLKDMIEHLSQCQHQLEWAEDNESKRVITETMLRDLERCQRLCETLHQRTLVRQAV